MSEANKYWPPHALELDLERAKRSSLYRSSPLAKAAIDEVERVTERITGLEAALSDSEAKVDSLEGHHRDFQIILEELGLDGESSTRDVKAHLEELKGYYVEVCRQDQKISDLETELRDTKVELRQLKEKKSFSILRWLGFEIGVD